MGNLRRARGQVAHFVERGADDRNGAMAVGGRLSPEAHAVDELQRLGGAPRAPLRIVLARQDGRVRRAAFSFASDEDVVGRQHARDGDPHGAFERAWIAELAGRDGEGQGFRRRNERRAPPGNSRLRVARAQCGPGARRGIELARRNPRVGLDDARARGDEVRQRAGPSQRLEHLPRGHRHQEVESGGDPLALEERRDREEIAKRGPAVASEEHLRHGASRQIAHRSHLRLLVEDEGIDGAEVEVHDFLAGRPCVRDEGPVGFGTPLISKKDFGALVAHEERTSRTDLRREGGEDCPLADRQRADTGTCELEHHGGAARLFDTLHDCGQAPAKKLERDVARANERPEASGEKHLDAHGRPHDDRTPRERARQRQRGHDEGEHSDAPDSGHAWLVRHAKARGTGKALEVDGPRVPDARSRDEEAAREHFPRHRTGVVARPVVGRRHAGSAPGNGRARDAVAVVNDGHLGGSLLQAGGHGFGESPHRRTREHDLVDAHFEHLTRSRRRGRAAQTRREDLLGHRTGRISGSCAHRLRPGKKRLPGRGK